MIFECSVSSLRIAAFTLAGATFCPGVPGGIITFGGGVALYSGGQVIGGLGVSGDSSCADHAIAYRMRGLAGFAGIPGGVGPGGTDNIAYAAAGVAPTVPAVLRDGL